MLSCLGEWNTVSAASILFPWMPPVHLIFLKICLNTVDYHCPLKTCASQKALGSHIPRYVSAIIHRSSPSAGQTHRTGKPKHIHTLVHACGNVLTLRLICPYDAKQRLMVLCNPPCFNVFWGTQTCCIYRENSHRSHSLTGCRRGRFPSQDNLLCWNDIGNTRHQTWIHFTYSNVVRVKTKTYEAVVLHKYILSSLGGECVCVCGGGGGGGGVVV